MESLNEEDSDSGSNSTISCDFSSISSASLQIMEWDRAEELEEGEIIESSEEERESLRNNTNHLVQQFETTKSWTRDQSAFRLENDTITNLTKIVTLLENERNGNSRVNRLRRFLRKEPYTYHDGERNVPNIIRLVNFLLPSESLKDFNFNMSDEHLIAYFSFIFNDDENIHSDDTSDTIYQYSKKKSEEISKNLNDTTVTMTELENCIKHLAEDDSERNQLEILKMFADKCRPSDLKTVVRIIQKNMRTKMGTNLVLRAIGGITAFKSFDRGNGNVSQIIKSCIDGGYDCIDVEHFHQLSRRRWDEVFPFHPVKPMLADICSSSSYPIKKLKEIKRKKIEERTCNNPNAYLPTYFTNNNYSFYLEEKYDGERLQVHMRKGTKLKFFSRSLRPMEEYKVKSLRAIVPRAFPGASSLIVDGELLKMFDKTGKEKKKLFCYFIFDILYYNGINLCKYPIKKRRGEYLENSRVFRPVHNKIMLTNATLVSTIEEIDCELNHAYKNNLEGIVLKETTVSYHPDRRYWFKIKLSYLDANMDTCDLVLLGGWLNEDNATALLFGCFDDRKGQWTTVCKIKTDSISTNDTMKMIEDALSKNVTAGGKENISILNWKLIIDPDVVPDFFIKDPMKAPVCEIRGLEFIKVDHHTANGISLRFPKIVSVRTDKDANNATTLCQLEYMSKFGT